MASRIATFCAGYIGEHGPTSVDDLHQAALAAHVTTARTSSGVSQAVRYRDHFYQLPDGRYTTTSRLLAGSVLTHRVRGPAPPERLWIGQELAPLRSLLDDSTTMPLDPDGEITSSRYQPDVWIGPSGWLPAVEPGELLGVRWTGAAIQIFPVQLDADEVDDRARDVRSVLQRHRLHVKRAEQSYAPYSRSDNDDLTKIVVNALLEVPDLLSSPVLPLDELMGRSPDECVRELYRSLSDVFEPEYEARVTLSVPEPLVQDLTRRAELSGVDVEDLMVGLLAREVLSTTPREFMPPTRRFPERAPVSDHLDDQWVEPDVIRGPLRAI